MQPDGYSRRRRFAPSNSAGVSAPESRRRTRRSSSSVTDASACSVVGSSSASRCEVLRLAGERLRRPEHLQLEPGRRQPHARDDRERPRLLRLRHEAEPAEQQPPIGEQQRAGVALPDPLGADPEPLGLPRLQHGPQHREMTLDRDHGYKHGGSSVPLRTVSSTRPARSAPMHCTLVPPYILQALARHGDPAVRDAAIATLGFDRTFAVNRLHRRPDAGSRRPATAAPVGAAPPPPDPRRPRRGDAAGRARPQRGRRRRARTSR